MGCGGSKIQNEEGISRCRRRKRVVKHAVKWRNQYAIAHSDYILSLKNLSSAFRQFTDGEFRDQLNLSSSAATSATSSSASSTPIPATPTTPLKTKDFEEILVSSVKIPPKALRSNPPAPITVVVSPPKSPPRGRFTREEMDDAYQRYMENDAPPDGLYTDIMQPGKPHDSPSGASSSASYNRTYTASYGTYTTSGSGSENWYDSSYMDSTPSWDIFGIFSMPPSMMYNQPQFGEVIEEDEEELKRELEEEDLPALETASPKRDDVYVDHEDRKEHKQDAHPMQEVDEEKHVHEEEAVRKKKVDEHLEARNVEEIKRKGVEKSDSDEKSSKVDEERKPEKKEKLKEVLVSEIEEEEEPVRRREDVASSSRTKPLSGVIIEEIEDDEVFEALKAKSKVPDRVSVENFPSPPAAAKSAPVEHQPAATPKDLEVWDVLRVIDMQFQRAADFGADVSRLLEARRPNGSGFLDSRGLSERSARIFRAVSRSQWSPRTPLSWSEDSSSEDFAGASKVNFGGHAATLDKLYAWEKKLYIEVKEHDSFSSEFDRKCKHLKKLDARGASNEAIDKTRVDIKMLETRMHVSMQAMKSTSQAIQELTDKKLYEQLLELLEATMIMWKNMYLCHQKQKDSTSRMKAPGTPPLEATSNSHRLATQKLEAALNEWQRAFENLIIRQREYMRNLNSWLRLSIYTPDRKSEQKVRPPVHNVCQAWTTTLERLQEEKLVVCIKSFAETIHNIARQQEEEAKAQKRAEAVAKELSKKALALNNAQKKLVAEGSVDEEVKASLERKKAGLEVFRRRVEDEKESFTRAIQVTRKMTAGILETELPRLFDSLDEFSGLCLEGYQELHHKARNNEFDAD